MVQLVFSCQLMPRPGFELSVELHQPGTLYQLSYRASANLFKNMFGFWTHSKVNVLPGICQSEKGDGARTGQHEFNKMRFHLEKWSHNFYLVTKFWIRKCLQTNSIENFSCPDHAPGWVVELSRVSFQTDTRVLITSRSSKIQALVTLKTVTLSTKLLKIIYSLLTFLVMQKLVFFGFS